MPVKNFLYGDRGKRAILYTAFSFRQRGAKERTVGDACPYSVW